jgi:hypothetical protein
MIREGDKLKITFFETMDLPDVPGLDRGSGDSSRLRVFYQRLDLSGEYTVEAGGAVSIPIVGAVGAAGKSTDQLRDGVLAALEKATRRGGNASVAIVARQPVFVTGAVRHPGPFPYMSGMIAIQALALAGGPDQVEFGQMLGLVDRAAQTELARDRLIKALARRAVMMAGRNGTIALPPRLVDLVGQESAREIVGLERRIIEARLDEKQSLLTLKQNAAVATREEITAIQGRVADLDRQIAARSDRVQKMEGLLANRIVSDERVSDIRRDLLDLQGRKGEYKVALIQTQSRLSQTEAEVKNAETARRAELDAEINQLDQQIVEAERSLRAGDKTLSLANQRVSGVSSKRLRIIRVDGTGPKTFDAEDTTELAPGDVLTLTDDPAAASAAASPPGRTNAAQR